MIIEAYERFDSIIMDQYKAKKLTNDTFQGVDNLKPETMQQVEMSSIHTLFHVVDGDITKSVCYLLQLKIMACSGDQDSQILPCEE